MRKCFTMPRAFGASVSTAARERTVPGASGVRIDVSGAILGLEFVRGPVWSNDIDSMLLEIVIETIAGIGPDPDQMLGLGLQHVEVEAELDS